MDISRFDSITLAEQGVDFEIPDPVTGLPTGVVFTLYGADSKTYQGAVKEIQQRNKARGVSTLSDEDNAEIFSRCIKGWRGLTEGGELIPFSQDKAKAILFAMPYIALQVATFVLTRAGFFPKPSEG